MPVVAGQAQMIGPRIDRRMEPNIPEPEPARPIMSALNMVEEATGGLECSIQSLERRLQPILLTVPDAAEVGKSPSDGTCELSHRLERLCARMVMCSGLIRDIESRAQV